MALHLHPVLYPITLCYIRSAVARLGLPAYAFSLSLLACWLSQYVTRFWPNTILWIVQRYAFGLYINLDTFSSLPGWMMLVNLGARRQKLQVIATMLWPCQLFFVKWMQASCIIISGLNTVRLESALDLVKKMGERRWEAGENHATKASWGSSQSLQGRFCINLYFIKFAGQSFIN